VHVSDPQFYLCSLWGTGGIQQLLCGIFEGTEKAPDTKEGGSGEVFLMTVDQLERNLCLLVKC
jgi:hypothetical protein